MKKKVLKCAETPTTTADLLAACEAMARGDYKTRDATPEWWAAIARIARRCHERVVNPDCWK